MDDLEVKLALILTAMAIEIGDELSGGEHFLHMRDVVQRRLGRESFGVGHRKCFFVAAMQLDALLFAALLNHRLQQPIAPRPRRLGQVRLDALDVGVGNAAGRCAHDEQPARQRRIGHMVVDRGIASVECFF